MKSCISVDYYWMCKNICKILDIKSLKRPFLNALWSLMENLPDVLLNRKSEKG